MNDAGNLDGLNRLIIGASQAVETPHDEHVTRSDEIMTLHDAIAISPLPTGHIDKDLFAAGLYQIIFLQMAVNTSKMRNASICVAAKNPFAPVLGKK